MIDDRMPNPFTREDDAIKERAAKLSQQDLCELVTLAGIIFASEYTPDSPEYLKELLETPKEMLISPLDEAASRKAVEDFLDSKGV